VPQVLVTNLFKPSNLSHINITQDPATHIFYNQDSFSQLGCTLLYYPNVLWAFQSLDTGAPLARGGVISGSKSQPYWNIELDYGQLSAIHLPEAARSIETSLLAQIGTKPYTHMDYIYQKALEADCDWQLLLQSCWLPFWAYTMGCTVHRNSNSCSDLIRLLHYVEGMYILWLMVQCITWETDFHWQLLLQSWWLPFWG